jgi:hypothetical protein
MFGPGGYPIPGWRYPAQEIAFTDERGAAIPPPDPRTRLDKQRVCIAYPGSDVEGCLVEARRKTQGAVWERKAWMARPWAGDRHPCMDLGDATAWQSGDRLSEFDFRLIPVRDRQPSP